MDPTRELTLIRPPFVPRPKLADVGLPKTYVHVSQVEDVPAISVTAGKHPLYVDADAYAALDAIKDRYSGIDPRMFKQLVADTNPYEALGAGPFINRASLKMANIDAVYKLLGHSGGLLVPQVYDDEFSFAAIAEGPGGFVQYIQYRSVLSRGHGITYSGKVDSLNWDVANLDPKRFDMDYPGRVTGDITAEWEAFCSHVLSKTGPVKLVTADGGVEVGSNYADQEQLNTRLIFTEALMALTLVAGRVDRGPTGGGLTKGGSFLLKIFDTVTKMSVDIIYILTRCFDKVSVFKPVTSRPANSERYVVCQDMHPKEEVGPWLSIMKEVDRRMREGKDVTGFIGSLDTQYVAWITDINNTSILSQTVVGNKILDMNEGKSIPTDRVDLAECLTIWNVPGERDLVACRGKRVTVAGGTERSRLNRRGRGRGR